MANPYIKNMYLYIFALDIRVDVKSSTHFQRFKHPKEITINGLKRGSLRGTTAAVSVGSKK